MRSNKLIQFKIYLAELILQIVENSCDILEEAMQRYKKIISEEYNLATKQYERMNLVSPKNSVTCEKYLQKLQIDLTGICEKYPHIKSDESCKFQARIFTFQLSKPRDSGAVVK